MNACLLYIGVDERQRTSLDRSPLEKASQRERAALRVSTFSTDSFSRSTKARFFPLPLSVSGTLARNMIRGTSDIKNASTSTVTEAEQLAQRQEHLRGKEQATQPTPEEQKADDIVRKALHNDDWMEACVLPQIRGLSSTPIYLRRTASSEPPRILTSFPLSASVSLTCSKSKRSKRRSMRAQDLLTRRV